MRFSNEITQMFVNEILYFCSNTAELVPLNTYKLTYAVGDNTCNVTAKSNISLHLYCKRRY